MVKITMYGTAISPPCRTVWLAAEALGIEIDNHETSLLAGDHMKDDFIKMNPQHTVPTIQDNGFCLWDSHAIICYLANKYGKNDALYPKDSKLRAIIDQRLHFDTGVLFASLRFICKPVFYDLKKSIPDEDIKLIKESIGFLNKFLEGRNWLAGENYTLADIACICTVTSISVIVSLDSFPNVKAWVKRCEQQLPGYAKLNKPGNDLFHQVVLSKLSDAPRYPVK